MGVGSHSVSKLGAKSKFFQKTPDWLKTWNIEMHLPQFLIKEQNKELLQTFFFLGSFDIKTQSLIYKKWHMLSFFFKDYNI